MNGYLSAAIISLFLMFSPIASAVEVEVPGLITDHTVTATGHDFYRAFSDKWEKDFKGNITISEKPSARWGSWITIKIDQDVLHQAFLFPSKRDFNRNVELAIDQVAQKLARRQIDQSLLNTGDLTRDEF
ncbi:curli production assembly/transport protein CsgE [Limnobaculum zhutongyuii]|uniref:Curli production assembly/transport component CsgE n=1 Tax=Limnobaculum zhutongyuii TaxID=2498113 RepID=A0A411WMJ5_9GAMM|nr:curli production assembly/transport protein CsgE [Limnobaculum zhutongyuii]QBH97453.1 curli production assembly/transport protein CsgE [Limnobaculum zhutongyuii]TQS90928.1 curli production assembly/transport protein CsgE [Limnobaculum zhutongyuii]